MTKADERNGQLDLLRATAISMVVIYHLVLMSPVELIQGMRWTKPGQYGVDLFFVLSGWLIGGLYWRERSQHGDVDIKRFWLRRSLRTVPPYFVALAFAWAAAYYQRRAALPPDYLVFAQNYNQVMPMFLVSWSLCIEEHFYAVVPAAVSLLGRSRTRLVMLFSVLVMGAALGRTLDPMAATHGTGEFGYAWTATHLRLEGLLLGFAAAAIPVFRPGLWSGIQNYRGVLLGASTLLLLATLMLSKEGMYHVGLSLLAVGFLGVLLAIVERPRNRVSASGLVRAVAAGSYSVYLLHSVMLHLARLATARLPHGAWFLYFPVALGLIVSTGAIFHVLIENTSIRLRDALAPRRSAVAHTAVRAVLNG